MLRNSSYSGHQRALSLADRKTYLSVSDCRFCGQAIAWATSAKTGKRYPCAVVAKQSEEFGLDSETLRAEPWNVHHCQPRKDV